MVVTKHLHRAKLIPELRFKGFNGKWVKERLGEVSEFLDGRRKPIKSEDRSKMQGEYPYYGASGIIDYVNEYIFDEEIILLGEDGENIVSRNLPLAFRVSGMCWVNNHAHVIRNNKGTDIDFLTYVLELTNYTIYNTGTAQPKLNQEVCRNIPLYFPTLPEQQKIASFLSAIDEKIQLLTRKKELLEQYKKGVMQQLFSGKLRFKNENGKVYPQWEEKRLGEVGKLYAGGDLSKLDYRKEKVGEYTYPIYANGAGEGLYGFATTFQYNANCVTVSGRGNLGYANARQQNFNAIVRLIVIEPKQYISPKYLEEMINSINFAVESTGVPQLTVPQISSYKILVPCIEEQQKIANYLSAIDTKIESVATHIAQTQTFKKGLLQQMFV